MLVDALAMPLSLDQESLYEKHEMHGLIVVLVQCRRQH
jgi:hypothetical protein